MTTPESWKFTWLTLLFVYTGGPKTKVNRQPVIWGLLAITALIAIGLLWTPLGFLILGALVIIEPLGL